MAWFVHYWDEINNRNVRSSEISAPEGVACQPKRPARPLSRRAWNFLARMLFGLVRVACYPTMLRPCVMSVGHGFCWSEGAHRLESESVLTVHRGQRFPIETIRCKAAALTSRQKRCDGRCQIAAGSSFLSEQVVDNGNRLSGGVALIATDGDALADLQWHPSADLVFRSSHAG